MFITFDKSLAGQLTNSGLPPASGPILKYLASFNGVKSWKTVSIVTPSALTKVDDINVTLTLGGSPSVALLAATSLTLGWTGTLADSRIASAATWNAKQDALSLTTTGTSGAATLIGSTLNIPQYALPDEYDTQIAMYQDLGSAVVAGTYGVTFDRMSATVAGGALSTGQAIFMLIRFTKADTILGLKWFHGTQGNYTANNYNGVFLATLSAGTLSVVASSVNDGNIWKGTSNTMQSKAFSAGYAVTANTTYVVGAMYSSSAQVTLPTIYGIASQSTFAIGQADFANSVCLYASKPFLTAIPTTLAYSTLTRTSNILPVFFAYK